MAKMINYTHINVTEEKKHRFLTTFFLCILAALALYSQSTYSTNNTCVVTATVATNLVRGSGIGSDDEIATTDVGGVTGSSEVVTYSSPTLVFIINDTNQKKDHPPLRDNYFSFQAFPRSTDFTRKLVKPTVLERKHQEGSSPYKSVTPTGKLRIFVKAGCKGTKAIAANFNKLGNTLLDVACPLPPGMQHLSGIGYSPLKHLHFYFTADVQFEGYGTIKDLCSDRVVIIIPIMTSTVVKARLVRIIIPAPRGGLRFLIANMCQVVIIIIFVTILISYVYI